MSEVRDFFQCELSRDELEEQVRSADAATRWAAAVELGEIGDAWAASLVRRLLTDSDEFVRSVAQSVIRKFDASVLRDAGLLPVQGSSSSEVAPEPSRRRLRSHLDAPEFVAWKIRPLPAPTRENRWLLDAALIDIIDTEAPVLGRRLVRLYGRAVYPDCPSRMPRAPLQAAAQRLLERGIVVRCDDLTMPQLEHWVLCRAGRPAAQVRQRGDRQLDEIPVSEVVAALHRISTRARLGCLDKETAFQMILDFYAVKPSEYHLVGRLLAEDWSALLHSGGTTVMQAW